MEPLVLCHGGPGVSDYLGPLEELLAPHVEVHRFQQRGDHPRELVAQIEALGLPRCIAGGHSWGAALALLYALEHPERVDRLLYLCGTGIETGWEQEHSETQLGRLPAEDAERARRLRDEPGRPRGRELLMLLAPTEVHDPADARRLPRIEWVDWENNRRVWSGWLEMLPSLPERVRACEVPALIVQGASDPRPSGPAKRLAYLLPNARYEEIERAGHYPWVDREEEFLRIVTTFLRGG